MYEAISAVDAPSNQTRAPAQTGQATAVTSVDATREAEVKAAVDSTISASKKDANSVEGTVMRAMADTNLDAQQRAEYIAAVLDQVSNNRSLSETQKKNILQGIDRVGTLPTDEPAKMNANLTAAIADAHKSYDLTIEKIAQLVNPTYVPYADGAKNLVSDLPPATLNRLSSDLQQRAIQLYESSQRGSNPAARSDMNGNPTPVIYAGAAMNTAIALANKAAEGPHGIHTAANKALETLDKYNAAFNKNPKGMGLFAAIGFSSDYNVRGARLNGPFEPGHTPPTRSALTEVAKLINASTLGRETKSIDGQTILISNAADRLFARIVSLEKNGITDLSTYGSKDKSNLLGELGKYFDKNIDAITRMDAQNRNATTTKQELNNSMEFLTRDYFANVFFNSKFTEAGRKNNINASNALGNTLFENINGKSNTQQTRIYADQFGTLVGSLYAGANDYVSKKTADAKDNAERKAFVAGIVTDLIVNSTVKDPITATIVGMGTEDGINFFVNREVKQAETKAKKFVEANTEKFKEDFTKKVKEQGLKIDAEVGQEFMEQLILTSAKRS